jgi:zinc protease
MRHCALLLSLATAISAPAGAAPGARPFDRAAFAIPHQTFVLDNGLTLIVHEDHAAPIVSVNLWYHVGSRNELPGRTGFAHLFEHFFFNGSEHHPGGFREAMDDLGAVNRNGTTDTDRTNFFEDVPVSALEKTLFLEADRMGFLAKQINQAMLERERGVVKNEKRQAENQPYGRVWTHVPERLYPASHPYSWSTIGRMEDLDAATLDDIQAWYRQYYGPSNCVLSLAGDITPQRALELVTKYFGDIPPGPPLTRARAWVPRFDASVREEMQDRVPQTRIYRVHHAPALTDPDVDRLELLASVLSGSDSARLDRRLVHGGELATAVSAVVAPAELASQLAVMVTLREGVDPARAEAEVDGIVAELLRTGPTEAELARARSRILADFARASEALGAFGGRAAILAESRLYRGRADGYLDRLERIATASAGDVRAAGRRWLDAPHYTLRVTPLPPLRPAAAAIDRARVPALGAAGEVTFPAVQRARLSNGLEVLLLERHGAPLVNLALALDAGHAADPPGREGLASLALELLQRGTKKRDFFVIVDALDAAGARMETQTTLDESLVRLEALSTQLRPALAIFAEAILQPTFPADRLEQARKQRLARIAQEKAQPAGLAYRLVPSLLFGGSHPYGKPFSGTGEHASIAALTREELVRWHRDWFRPGSATLVVTGDITLATLVPELERVFAAWGSGRAPEKRVAPVARPAARAVYLVDRPGAEQTTILAAHVAEPGGRADDLAVETFMRGFGGMATSRLNRNLRLEKHWTYGARAWLLPARGQRPFLVMTSVQADKSAESIAEVMKELEGIAGKRPIRGEEFQSLMRTQTLGLPGRFATLAALENAALDLLTYRYPDDHFATYARRVRALDEAALAAAARALVHPGAVTLVVVGDLAKIDARVRALGLGPVTRLDADGKPLL